MLLMHDMDETIDDVDSCGMIDWTEHLQSQNRRMIGLADTRTTAEEAWLSLRLRLSLAKSLPERVPACEAGLSAVPAPPAPPAGLRPLLLPQRRRYHSRTTTPPSLFSSSLSLSPAPSSSSSSLPAHLPNFAHLSVLPLSALPLSSNLASYSIPEEGQEPSSPSFITHLRPSGFHIHYVNSNPDTGLSPLLEPPLLTTSRSTYFQQEEFEEPLLPFRPLSSHPAYSSTTSQQARNVLRGRRSTTRRVSLSSLKTSRSSVSILEQPLSSEYFDLDSTEKLPFPEETDDMGLMRALTTSRRSATPQRPLTTLLKSRPQISLPTELISTTNILSYTAPSVESMRAAAAHTSTTSSSPTTDSNRASFAASEEPSLTDDSSVSSESSPGSPESTSRHDYFRTSGKPTLSIKTGSMVSVVDMDNVSPTTQLPTPVLPRRAASHSKREHLRLAHRRSQRVQSLGPLSASTFAASIYLESSDALSELAEKHPFSQELEQLNEVVEELGVLVEGEDERVMEMLGLRKWTPEQYILDFQGLLGEGQTLFA